MAVERIVDISTDNLYLSVKRGFLLVEKDGAEQGRVALDDIAALIIHGHGISWSTNLVVRLAERGAMIVLCAANHAPVAYLAPIEGHHAQNARIRAQWDAGLPLRKRLWQRLVAHKITMQAALLAAVGREEAEALRYLARRVRSGDPDNVEAQAARRYWQALFGSEFRRDRSAGDANALLNYGYVVLRACVARSIVAAGLHPSIGIHHANRLNSFALADDLVEVFRPLVDAVVWAMRAEAHDKSDLEVDSTAKTRLVALTAADMQVANETTPMTKAAHRLCYSLVQSFEDKKVSLELPSAPSPLLWRSWMKAPEA